VKEDRLGEYLLEKGTIDQAIFDEASRVMKETGKRLGATLVELGHISEESMKREVAEQFMAIVQSLYEWDTGHFGFESLDELAEEDVVIQVSTAETILAGVRRKESTQTIRKALGNLDQVLVPSENPLLLYQKVNLTPEEGFILSRADGTTTVGDTASLSPLGEENTLKCIYGLVAAGVLELQDKSTQKAKPRVVPTPEVEIPKPKVEPAEPKVAPPKPAEAKAKAPVKGTKPIKDQSQLRNEIAAKHASLAKANHYELLGVSTTASKNEIKTAYFAAVKAYHPDRHHQEHMKDMRGLLEELLAKITDAYQVLTDEDQRKGYDRKVLKPEPSKPTATSGAASRPPTTSAASPGQEISSASHEELAEKQYYEGKRRFADMSYFDAIQCLREAVRLDPSKAEYHKLLAQSLAKNPNWLKDAEEHFQKAIDIDSFDGESYEGLAKIYSTMGMKTRCERVCEKLLEIDPENALAQKLSGKKKSGSQTRMRLKSLFGKKD
jgi:curved DNA-binding protein CbpA